MRTKFRDPLNHLGAGVQKSNILNIRDIRQLSLRLDNLRLRERQNAGLKAQPAKRLDNIPNRRQSLYEWLDKILWPQSKQMQSLVQ